MKQPTDPTRVEGYGDGMAGVGDLVMHLGKWITLAPE
jgi:hypothetical protein